MTAMAEVIDESIRNMTQNMVTKADQEKVYSSSVPSDLALTGELNTVSLHPESRLCATEIRNAVDGEERS
jgi:hypothetical protein